MHRLEKLYFNSFFKKWFWLLALLDILAIQFSQSTFDSGDSVLHYLHARQALRYPHYFLEHWSKPLFVLLAAIPASFGFWGMKLFNSICVLGATWFAFKLLEKRTELAWMVFPFSLAAPEYFLSQASGLTEPLFSTLLMASLYAWDQKKFPLSLIIASFLPFVRSEGWFVLPFFAAMALFSENRKSALWLITGHLIYGVAGWLADGDFLWMFHENPYQGIEVKYGSGHWSHYLLQTPFLLGIPLTLLLVSGMFKPFRQLKSFSLKSLFSVDFMFIYGITLAFYVAHSIFWHFGWFHSFGLKRVFIAVIPLMIIIAVYGMEWIIQSISNLRLKRAFTAVCAAVVMVFPFTPNQTGYDLPATFQLEPSQKLIGKVAEWYRHSPYKDLRIAYGNHYFAMILKKDMDNPNEVVPIGKVLNGQIPRSTIIFWDNYFAESDQGVSIDKMEQAQYPLLHVYKDSLGNEIRVYEVE